MPSWGTDTASFLHATGTSKTGADSRGRGEYGPAAESKVGR